MSRLLCGMLLLSVLAAVLTGNGQTMSSAAMEGAQQAIKVTLTLAGPLCLWSGVGALLRRSGLSKHLTVLLRPLLSRLFPTAYRDAEASECISANVTANLLGLGNAATPMGIAAVRRMKLLSRQDTATDELCRFVVLNTASVQLLPTTVASLRAAAGAAKPFDILPAVWLTSICSVTAGLLCARLLQRCRR